MQELSPPTDLTAEAAVLSAVLLDSSALDRIQPIVAPEHFFMDANKQIYSAFLGLLSENSAIDILTVRSWLTDRGMLQRVGGAEYLAEILDSVPTITNVDAYARRIKEKWRLRELIATCQRLVAESYGQVDSVQQFIDGAEQSIYDIARTPETTTVHTLKSVMHSAFNQLTYSLHNQAKNVGVHTGLHSLDEITGGFRGGDLVILAARPGMGKTALALNVARNCAANGNGVAMFSLEMPKEQLALRMLCSDAKEDVGALRTASTGKINWSRLTVSASQLSKLNIYIDDTSDLTVLNLRAKLRRIVAMQSPGSKLGLVIVDYLQLMAGNPKLVSREQQISEISRNLKKLAKDMSLPIMALSQLNRSVESRSKEDRRPQLSDLRESGAIEQDADTVIFVYRPDYYKKNEQNKYYEKHNNAENTAELIVSKQRNGPTGTACVRFTKFCTRFDNLDTDDISVTV